jgi:hypothetical protein
VFYNQRRPWRMATGSASCSMTTSVPARTRASSAAKLLAASASETWMICFSIPQLYTATLASARSGDQAAARPTNANHSWTRLEWRPVDGWVLRALSTYLRRLRGERLGATFNPAFQSRFIAAALCISCGIAEAQDSPRLYVSGGVSSERQDPGTDQYRLAAGAGAARILRSSPA